MKTLVLLRHAKSEEASLIKPDFKRHLRERGVYDIKKVASHFKSLNIKTELVLCSTAYRTVETLKEFAEICPSDSIVNYVDDLYHATALELLALIQEASEGVSSILVVGHNFGISQLADYLGKQGCSNLPTSGLVVFEFENEIEQGKGELRHFIIPKDI